MLVALLLAFTPRTFAEETKVNVSGKQVVQELTNMSIERNHSVAISNDTMSQSKALLRGTVLSLADYGNWCGLFNTRDDPSYPTVDGVDEVCRRHDLCLKDKGYHECNCDADFMKRMARASARNAHGESYRRVAVRAFLNKPCECRRKRCILRNPFNGKCIKYIRYNSAGISGICLG